MKSTCIALIAVLPSLGGMQGAAQLGAAGAVRLLGGGNAGGCGAYRPWGTMVAALNCGAAVQRLPGGPGQWAGTHTGLALLLVIQHMLHAVLSFSTS